MGDRVLTVFTDGVRTSPVVYQHWGGAYQWQKLVDVRELMKPRSQDVDYTAARFVGICHGVNPDSALSLGIWDYGEGRAFESHGDNGAWRVNVRDWTVEISGGYGGGWSGPLDEVPAAFRGRSD